MLALVNSLRHTPTIILASGDPLWFGIAATLLKHFGPAELDIHPGPSSLQLAAARLGWPLQHVATLSLHARPVTLLHPHLTPGNRILALTSDRTTLHAVQALLKARGYEHSMVKILENLGAPDERIHADAEATSDLYVLAIDCVADPRAMLLPTIPGLPDEAFVHDGQLTKRDIRAATLAKLAPYPGARLWDIGAGCGSVAIEWLRAARDTHAIAFERDPARLAMIRTNADALGTPGLVIVPGDLPATLAGQPPPDAIFLGGAVSDPALFAALWENLRPGGHLVANAVTLDGEQALLERSERFGGDLTRLDISVLDHVGGHRVLRPRMAVTQWAMQKP